MGSDSRAIETLKAARTGGFSVGLLSIVILVYAAQVDIPQFNEASEQLNAIDRTSSHSEIGIEPYESKKLGRDFEEFLETASGGSLLGDRYAREWNGKLIVRVNTVPMKVPDQSQTSLAGWLMFDHVAYMTNFAPSQLFWRGSAGAGSVCRLSKPIPEDANEIVIELGEPEPWLLGEPALEKSYQASRYSANDFNWTKLARESGLERRSRTRVYDGFFWTGEIMFGSENLGQCTYRQHRDDGFNRSALAASVSFNETPFHLNSSLLSPDIWPEIASKTIPEARQFFEDRLKSWESKTVSFWSIEFAPSLVSILMPVLLIALVLNVRAHCLHLFRNRELFEDDISKFGWIALYPDRISKILTLLMIGVMPPSTVVMLTYRNILLRHDFVAYYSILSAIAVSVCCLSLVRICRRLTTSEGTEAPREGA